MYQLATYLKEVKFIKCRTVQNDLDVRSMNMVKGCAHKAYREQQHNWWASSISFLVIHGMQRTLLWNAIL